MRANFVWKGCFSLNFQALRCIVYASFPLSLPVLSRKTLRKKTKKHWNNNKWLTFPPESTQHQDTIYPPTTGIPYHHHRTPARSCFPCMGSTHLGSSNWHGHLWEARLLTNRVGAQNTWRHLETVWTKSIHVWGNWWKMVMRPLSSIDLHQHA